MALSALDPPSDDGLSEWEEQPASPEMDRWMTKQTALGREPSPRIDVEIIQPPDRVADRLALGPDALVVVRRRVRYLNNEPFNIKDTYYPFELVQGSVIVNPADITRGASEVLAGLGYEQVRAIDEFEAWMPLPNGVSRLEWGLGGRNGTKNPLKLVSSQVADSRNVSNRITYFIPATRYAGRGAPSHGLRQG